MQSRIKTLQVYHTDFDVKKFVDTLYLLNHYHYHHVILFDKNLKKGKLEEPSHSWFSFAFVCFRGLRTFFLCNQISI